jgi:hypothetical protein
MSLEMGSQHRGGQARLYAGVIAIITGAYSFLIGMLSTYFEVEPVLIVLGFVIGIHGAVMVTPLAERYMRANGVLMMLFATLTIAYQAWMGITTPMGRSMGQELGAWVNPGYDMGMVALGLLLFLAGVITFFIEEA